MAITPDEIKATYHKKEQKKTGQLGQQKAPEVSFLIKRGDALGECSWGEHERSYDLNKAKLH